MLLHNLIVSFALFAVCLATDLTTPLSCRFKNQLPGLSSIDLSAMTLATPHGSMGQGSVRPSASRCPRVKPTLTITSAVTSGTSTVTTSPGFTPILSEAYSVSFNLNRRRQLPSQSLDTVVVSLNAQGQATTSASELPQSMICGPGITSSPSTLTLPTNCPAMSTVTTTTTATVATSTIYDACSSNNLVNQGFGKGVDHGISSLLLHNVSSTTDTIDATTAYDCCVACQMLGCAYGGFLENPPNPYCELYFQESCDPGTWLGSTFNYNADIVGALPPRLGYTVFNGPCGQIVYGGSNLCKDPPCA